MNRMLILAMLPFALGANASCVTDPPEMGDIGPGSGLVCQELTQRFPGATLAVEGRSIHSPTEVRVTASVDGRPILLGYRLAGVEWVADEAGSRSADTASSRSDRPRRMSLPPPPRAPRMSARSSGAAYSSRLQASCGPRPPVASTSTRGCGTRMSSVPWRRNSNASRT